MKKSTTKKTTARQARPSNVSATKKTAKETGSKKTSARASARTSARQSERKAAAADRLFGLPLRAWVGSAKISRAAGAKSAKAGHVFFFGHRKDKEIRATLKSALLPWQLDHALKTEADTQVFAGKNGPVFILRPSVPSDRQLAEMHGGTLEKSLPARARDQMGSLVNGFNSWKLDTVLIHFIDTALEEERAALAGLEMGSYIYAENRDNPNRKRRKLPKLQLKQTQLKPEDVREAANLGMSVNIARHLTNLPGGDLNPETYSKTIETLFADSATTSVEVWRGERLKAERMNLLLAVGGGAQAQPCLVHIRYRPKNSEGRRPLALVGKGITFDTGGLDIKPSSAMRWMKKDMGGSAAVAAIALWVERAGLEIPLDFYLALAENAVDAGSFRPGDVITARNGATVEIHNTDAEGRLVLADALDVAVKAEGGDEPFAVINLATLTGAIKIALGADIAGLFCNNDGLSELIEESSSATGELAWRMPLFQPYRNLFKSTFADMANASDGFAGAITAALFLQQFVGKTPWAHLDIYAWRDGAGGAHSENGGSGQSVQMLAHLLTRLAHDGAPWIEGAQPSAR